MGLAACTEQQAETTALGEFRTLQTLLIAVKRPSSALISSPLAPDVLVLAFS